MKLFAILGLALADPVPFDAVAICCDSVIVKGFDPVEGTYKLGNQILLSGSFHLTLSRYIATSLARTVQTGRRGRRAGSVIVLLIHANVRLVSLLATRRLGVWRSRARKWYETSRFTSIGGAVSSSGNDFFVSFDTQLFFSSTVVYGCHLMMSTVGKRQKYQLFVVEKNLNKEQSKSVCSTPFFFRPTLHKPHTQLRRPFIIITPLCSALYFCCFNNVVDYNPKTDLESGGQKPKLD